MTETTKMTTEYALDCLVNLFKEVNTLNEDVKALKDEMKELEMDVPTIAKAAKLIADEGYQTFREKTGKVLDVLEGVGK